MCTGPLIMNIRRVNVDDNGLIECLFRFTQLIEERITLEEFGIKVSFQHDFADIMDGSKRSICAHRIRRRRRRITPDWSALPHWRFRSCRAELRATFQIRWIEFSLPISRQRGFPLNSREPLAS